MWPRSYAPFTFRFASNGGNLREALLATSRRTAQEKRKILEPIGNLVEQLLLIHLTDRFWQLGKTTCNPIDDDCLVCHGSEALLAHGSEATKTKNA